MDANPLEALTALIESDGWKLFLDAVDMMHGDTASVQQIDTALKAIDRGDVSAAHDTVQQIRARARAVQAMVRWPEEQIATLKAKKAKAGMFQTLRRA